MPLLEPGSHLDHFEILRRLGSGGMGDVWLARDTRLNRSVAIKVSKEKFSERFLREARSIAALNHPNVCTLFDVGPDYLVMEYLEGSHPRGPLPLPDILRIGAELCDALAAAHRQGFTHRDLKPANILLTSQGLKLLDFGLASHSAPTPSLETQPLTAEGAIVGTLHYMAPEQLTGQPADARSDIFSLGLVLYELYSGARPFAASSQAALIAAILKEPHPPLFPGQPPPSHTHLRFARLLDKCLAKDPQRRWQSVQDLADELRWLAGDLSSSQLPTAPPPQPARRWPLVAFPLALFVLGFALYRYLPLLSTKPDPTVKVWSIPEHPAANPHFRYPPRISPDGNHVAWNAYLSGKPEIQTILYNIATGSLSVLPGCDSLYVDSWSIDSSRLVLSQGSSFQIYDLSLRQLTPFPANAHALKLYRDFHIMATNDGIFRGTLLKPTETRLSPAGPSTLAFQANDPSGSSIFVISRSSVSLSPSSLDLLNTRDGTIRPLKDLKVKSIFAPPDFFLVNEGGTLFASSFDSSRADWLGTPQKLPVGFSVDEAWALSLSTNGLLAIRDFTRKQSGGLFLVNRKGEILRSYSVREDFSNPDISPDGRWVAVSSGTSRRRIRAFDLRTGTEVQIDPFTEESSSPTWSANGNQIFFTSPRPGTNSRQISVIPFPQTSPPATVFNKAERAYAEQVIPRTSLLIFNGFCSAEQKTVCLFTLDLTAPAAPPRVLISEPSNVDQAQVSPDGRWIAYRGMGINTQEVFVQPYPPNGKRWQISQGGGAQPRWRADSKELFFTNGFDLRSLPIETSGQDLIPTPARPLFPARLNYYSRSSFAVSPDGQSFVIPGTAMQELGPIRIIQNWRQLLPPR